MGLGELASRTAIANVVAGAVMLLVTLHAIRSGDSQMLRDMAFLAAGYLFGVTVPRTGGGR